MTLSWHAKWVFRELFCEYCSSFRKLLKFLRNQLYESYSQFWFVHNICFGSFSHKNVQKQWRIFENGQNDLQWCFGSTYIWLWGFEVPDKATNWVFRYMKSELARLSTNAIQIAKVAAFSIYEVKRKTFSLAKWSIFQNVNEKSSIHISANSVHSHATSAREVKCKWKKKLLNCSTFCVKFKVKQLWSKKSLNFTHDFVNDIENSKTKIKKKKRNKNKTIRDD